MVSPPTETKMMFPAEEDFTAGPGGAEGAISQRGVYMVLVLLTVPLAAQLLFEPDAEVSRVISVASLLSICPFILANPVFGLVASVALLPLATGLRGLLGLEFAASVIGGVTLVSYLYHSRTRRYKPAGRGFFWTLCFVVWVVISNPRAAFVSGDRIWAFTLAQLLILSLLVSILIRDTGSHRALLVGFTATCALSALAVVVSGHVGFTLQTSARPGGMTGGANTAARYFIISLVCVYYLYVAAERRRRLSGAALLALAGLSLMGLAFTVSRSGYLLGAACFGMLLLAPSTGTRTRKLALLAVLVALTLYAVPRGVFPIATSIPSAIAEGADTAGLRYSLWRAGWIMFRDNWFTGVGIGQFSANLPVYGSGLVAPRHLDLTPHSMYVQLLCETGVGGFLLFAAAAAASLKNLLRMATAAADTQTKMAGWVWMTILVLLLLGGITKTDFSDKLLWVALGVGFSRELELGPEIPS